jgi:hypothetical protein
MMQIETNTIPEFSFEINSGKVHLTDPCYKTTTWCGAYNIPAKNGKWYAIPEDGESLGCIISAFTVYHEDHKLDEVTELLDYDLGVDSGQFGIFDTSIYDENTSYDAPGFYRNCCDITLRYPSCGIIGDSGFVSSSGYGDGSYPGYGAFDKDNNLVKFCVRFVFSEDDED